MPELRICGSRLHLWVGKRTETEEKPLMEKRLQHTRCDAFTTASSP